MVAQIAGGELIYQGVFQSLGLIMREEGVLGLFQSVPPRNPAALCPPPTHTHAQPIPISILTHALLHHIAPHMCLRLLHGMSVCLDHDMAMTACVRTRHRGLGSDLVGEVVFVASMTLLMRFLNAYVAPRLVPALQVLAFAVSCSTYQSDCMQKLRCVYYLLRL